MIGIVAALFLGVAAFAISQTSEDFDLELGKNGISIQVKKFDDLGFIIEKAEDSGTRRTARSILRDRGFVEVSQLSQDVLSKSLAREAGFVHMHDPYDPQPCTGDV